MEDQNSSNLKQKTDAAFSTPAGVAGRDGDVTTTTDRAAPEFMPSPDRRMSTNCNRWSDQDYLNSFPPGYRFCPTDTELVVYYLMKKSRGEKLPPNIIRDVNLYAYNPAQLIGRYRRNGESEWYFFTPRDKKYPRGSRPNRAAGDGYWKVTGQCKPVEDNKTFVGSKKALVFFVGKPPEGTKTNWIMHEFMLLDDITNVVFQPRPDMRLNDWVLCRIYEKIPKGGDDGGVGDSNTGNGSNGSDGGNNGGAGSSNGGADDANGSDGGNNGIQGNDHNAMNPVENHGTGTGYFHPEDDSHMSSIVERYFHEPQPYMYSLGPDLPLGLSAQTGPALSNHNGGAGLSPVSSGHNGGPVLRPMLPTHIGFGAPHGFGTPHTTDDSNYNSETCFISSSTAQPVSFRPPPPQNVYPQYRSSDPNVYPQYRSSDPRPPPPQNVYPQYRSSDPNILNASEQETLGFSGCLDDMQ